MYFVEAAIALKSFPSLFIELTRCYQEEAQINSVIRDNVLAYIIFGATDFTTRIIKIGEANAHSSMASSQDAVQDFKSTEIAALFSRVSPWPFLDRLNPEQVQAMAELLLQVRPSCSLSIWLLTGNMRHSRKAKTQRCRFNIAMHARSSPENLRTREECYPRLSTFTTSLLVEAPTSMEGTLRSVSSLSGLLSQGSQ